jgi:hypothetical protein
MNGIFKIITNPQLTISRILIQKGDKIKKIVTTAGSNIFHTVKNIMSTTLQQQMLCFIYLLIAPLGVDCKFAVPYRKKNLTQEKLLKLINLSIGYSDPNGRASKAQVCCRQLPGIVRSNPDGGVDDVLL